MEPADTRCSDGDREAAGVELRRHAAEGRLDLPELELRLEQALRASTRGELHTALDGLPTARVRRKWDERFASITRTEAVTAIIALLAALLWATGHLGEDAVMFAIAGTILVAVWHRVPRRRDDGSSANDRLR